VTLENRVLFGDSAAVRCVPGGTQYNKRYLTGSVGKPNLGQGLDFVENKSNYHATEIDPVHACILASRIREYRIRNGVMSVVYSHVVPCATCPNVEAVLTDQKTYNK
jgi:hypothetical protein